MALLAKALRNYHNKKFHKDLKEFSLMIAASVVTIPKKEEFRSLCNNVELLSENLYFEEPHDTFSHYVKQCHLVFKHLKASYSIYYQYQLRKITYLGTPMKVSEIALNAVTDAHSAIYTNDPGLTTTFSLFGYDVNELFFFVTGFGKLSMLFNVFTYNNTFNLAGIVDESTGINVKELLGDFQKLLKEYIIKMKDEMD